MNLTDVYDALPQAATVLWNLLAERDDGINISHAEMPTWDRHLDFVASRPYAAWYLIKDHDVHLGAAYLTHQDEIGIFIFKAHQGKGHGPVAIKLLIAAHPGRQFLANINPGNERSIHTFEKLGFKHIQQTYAL